MKNISKILNTRRIKGLFASIAEYGSMVSLGGTWSNMKEFKPFETKEDAQKALSEFLLTHKSDLRTRIRVIGKRWYIQFMEQGSLPDLILGFGWRLISAIFPGKVKFSSRLRLLTQFSNYVMRMYKTNGADQTVKFLKAAQLAVQKSIAKDPIKSLRDLDKGLLRCRLSGYGLPVIIPSRDRKLIRSGAVPIIRFWLTLFSVYRVIALPGTLKLSTIVDPLSVKEETFGEVVRLYNEFLNSLPLSAIPDKRLFFKEGKVLFLETASATQKVSWTGLMSDPAIIAGSHLAGYLRQVMTLLKQEKLLLLFESLLSITPSQEGLIDPLPTKTGTELDVPNPIYSHARFADPEGAFCGKLSTKEEAAGKVRVFAMVTIWDQMVLKPIHDALFAFLKSLPNDGTFDQGASSRRAAEKATAAGYSFGYDLSAATDRLPLVIQSALLNLVIPGLGTAWAKLLTSREYYMYIPWSVAKAEGMDMSDSDKAKLKARGGKVPNSWTVGRQEVDIYYNHKAKPWVTLKYSVGQPMGALSSWAMLAVTHHLIMQLAFCQAYKVPFSSWFTGYEVLGDDIIIFDKLVAAEYLSLMERFGVPINTSKSVCATVPVTEFAKVTTLFGRDVSALSWKMFMGANSLMGRVNLTFFLLNKGIVSKGIIPWIHRVNKLAPYKQGLKNPVLIALWTMLSNRGVITAEEALKALISGKDKVFKLGRAMLISADSNKIEMALPGIFNRTGLHLFENKAVKTIWSFELPWMKITMSKPLLVFRAKTDHHKDAEALTTSIMNMLAMKANIKLPDDLGLTLDFGSFYTDGAPDVSKIDQVPNLIDNDLRVIYSFFYEVVTEKLLWLGGPEVINHHFESPIPELVEANDKLSRYQELMQLVSRAWDKLDPDYQGQAPARSIRPTELKLVKLLAKMGQRPLFTTAASL